VKDSDKRAVIDIARRLDRLGYEIVSTAGTHRLLVGSGVSARKVFKIADGARPNVLDIVKNREVVLIINTPSGRGPRTDEGKIRGVAAQGHIPCITTVSGANALTRALEAYRAQTIQPRPLQEYLAQVEAHAASALAAAGR
jgi:carbamoyl-phosphate synthase large subunit